MKKIKNKQKNKTQKNKTLKLKPSMREKKRYLLVEIEKKINSKKAKELIESALLDFVGIWGYSKLSLEFVRSKQNKNSLNYVIAVNRKELEKTRAAFAICSDKIKVKKVSGTLKKLG